MSFTDTNSRIHFVAENSLQAISVLEKYMVYIAEDWGSILQWCGNQNEQSGPNFSINVGKYIKLMDDEIKKVKECGRVDDYIEKTAIIFSERIKELDFDDDVEEILPYISDEILSQISSKEHLHNGLISELRLSEFTIETYETNSQKVFANSSVLLPALTVKTTECLKHAASEAKNQKYIISEQSRFMEVCLDDAPDMRSDHFNFDSIKGLFWPSCERALGHSISMHECNSSFKISALDRELKISCKIDKNIKSISAIIVENEATVWSGKSPSELKDFLNVWIAKPV